MIFDCRLMISDWWVCDRFSSGEGQRRLSSENRQSAIGIQKWIDVK